MAANEVIEGTSQGISKDYRLWVVVYPWLINRYYFQDVSPNFMPNGDWSNSAVIGDAMSGGQKFDIYVVLANKEANSFIENHLQECSDKQSWPGLERLPEEVFPIDKVTTIRA